MRRLVDLSLAAEHRRGHGALYDGLNSGRLDIGRLRTMLAGLPLPRTADGRIVLAADASNWLCPDASTSADRLFCHVYGRARGQSQMIPGWPYSFVAALESGRTSWTTILDVVRLGPTDDATAVTVDQLRDVVGRLVAAGHWRDGDPEILVVADTGYDITRLAFVLADLPVHLLGRLHTDRVLRLPKPPPTARHHRPPTQTRTRVPPGQPSHVAGAAAPHHHPDDPLRHRQRLQLGPAAPAVDPPHLLGRPQR